MIRLITVLCLLLIGACGFTPMYGAGSNGSGIDTGGALSQVEIALIPDQEGVYLRNLLIDNFYQDGYPSNPAYILTVAQIGQAVQDLDITIESEATRKQIRLATSFTLTDRGTQKVVLSRNITALSSYNVLGSQFTTRISEDDAREAALNDLARQIETQVALYFKRK